MISTKFRRDISPRLLTFVNKIEDGIGALKKNMSRNARQELVHNVQVDVDMFASRWDLVHGENGMVKVLMNTIYAVMEQRLHIEYGDYLAVSLAELKKDHFDEKTRGKLYWRDNGDWCEIARVLRHELEELERIRRTPNTFGKPAETIETPILNDINYVANKLPKPVDPKQIIYEIEAYAARNQLCHIGIAKMIDECRWGDLADRVCHDKAQLELIYHDRPCEQANMRRSIGTLQEKWFEHCFLRHGKVEYVKSEEARNKNRHRVARLAQNNTI